MTESAPNGAGDGAGTPSSEAQPAPTTSEGTQNTDDGGQGNATPSFQESLSALEMDDVTKGFVEAKSPESLESLVKMAAHANMQALKSVPENPDADFFKRFAPEKGAEGYTFNKPKDFPEQAIYTKEFADSFKAKAAELGLHPSQAQGVHDWAAMELANGQVGQLKSVGEMMDAATEAIEEQYGAKDTEGNEKALALATQAIKGLDQGNDGQFQKALVDHQIISEDGDVLSKPIFDALVKLGPMFGEGNLQTQVSTTTTGNPFKQDERGRWSLVDPDGLSQLITANPSQARAYITGAGQKPEAYGL